MADDPADLGNLHDIVVPDAVPWWPPAPGWIVLAALLLLASIYYAYRRYRLWQAAAYRRAALRELAAARSPKDVAEVLRRTALAIAPRESVAALRGTAWTDWLAARSPDPLPENLATTLSSALYNPTATNGDLEALRAFASRWITRHTRTC